MPASPSHNSYESRLGLFWFLGKDRNPSRFAAFSRAVAEAGDRDGRQRLSASHADAWPKFQRLDPTLQLYGFDYFPRGHVEFLSDQQTWFLFLDQKLRRGAFITHIIIQWNIPRNRLITRWCDEYRSEACVGPPM